MSSWSLHLIDRILNTFDPQHSGNNTNDSKSNTNTVTTPCGEVIYSSMKLRNRLLLFRNDENHEMKDSVDDVIDLLSSDNSDHSVHLTFINETDHTLYIYWITFDGDIRTPGSRVKTKKEYKSNSYLTHPFVVSLSC